MDTLANGTSRLGIFLTEQQLEQLEVYYQEMALWNRRVNLTSITDHEDVMIKHFLDSYTLSPTLTDVLTSGGSVIDVGSGSGVPGIPLKIAFPSMNLVLLDSVGKKTRFLQHVAQTLNLDGVQILNGRAEDLAHKPELRERFDAVISRGVAALPSLMELTLPYCHIGGKVIAMKKGNIQHELDSAHNAIKILGGLLLETVSVNLDALQDQRLLVIVKKVNLTPAKFPRGPGPVKKRPL